MGVIEALLITHMQGQGLPCQTAEVKQTNSAQEGSVFEWDMQRMHAGSSTSVTQLIADRHA